MISDLLKARITSGRMNGRIGKMGQDLFLVVIHTITEYQVS